MRNVHNPSSVPFAAMHSMGADDDSSSTKDLIRTRREVLSGVAAISVSMAVGTPRVLIASASELSYSIGTEDRPIAIIGGGGRTGMAVAEALAGEDGMMYTVVMTRTGNDPFKIIKLPPNVKARVKHYSSPVDVRDSEAVLKALREVNASGVVFTASASKPGGNAMEVDSAGVKNVAKAAKSGQARLILVSALALDRPNSKSYQITNTMGGYVNRIMDAKLEGENMVREIMGTKEGDYVIIRPGVLLSGKTKSGAADIELNQGDTIGGGLSRDELAGIVVGALKSDKKGVTVEAYRKKTATKLQPDFAIPSGKELRASSYIGLFDGASSD